MKLSQKILYTNDYNITEIGEGCFKIKIQRYTRHWPNNVSRTHCKYFYYYLYFGKQEVIYLLRRTLAINISLKQGTIFELLLTVIIKP